MYEVNASTIPLLVEQIRAGSSDARRKLIEGLVGLAFNIAGHWEDDEALSAALLELVEAVDKFKVSGAPAETLISYVTRCITNKCIDVLRPRTRARIRAVPTDMTSSDSDDTASSGSNFSERHHKLRTNGDVPRFEQMDLILGSCEDAADREAVTLASMGYTQIEVAGIMQLHPVKVSRLVNRVEMRFRLREKLVK